jgi:hypothetical protein
VQLPFTRAQFFDLFAAYNAAVWPVLVLLWIASAVAGVLLLSSRRPPDRWIAALLAAHWAWSALAYHALFFTRINPAAWLFAALFLAQAALFVWWGVVQQRLTFAPWCSRWAPLGWALVAYALLYPAINASQHLTWSRIPAFGVPCPTTIFTAGLLMLAHGVTWRLTTVPIVWSVIGGSAAVLLDVRADYVLPIAGLALVRRAPSVRDPPQKARPVASELRGADFTGHGICDGVVRADHPRRPARRCEIDDVTLHLSEHAAYARAHAARRGAAAHSPCRRRPSTRGTAGVFTDSSFAAVRTMGMRQSGG